MSNTQPDFYDTHHDAVQKIINAQGVLLQIAEMPEVSLDEAPLMARQAAAKLQAALSEIGQLQNLYANQEERLTGAQKLAEETRGYLIAMWRYITRHGLLIGECVGWMNLKRRYDVGREPASEEAWAREKGYLP